MKVLIVGGANNYASWINREVGLLSSNIDNVKYADLVLFTGGADVDPSIYGASRNHKTHYDVDRDKYEIKFYRKALEYGKPIIGVCRGAQFTTAMQKNGYLVQHCNGHARSTPHQITWWDGDQMLVTSTHHQMMYPFNVRRHSVLAWSSPALSDIYEFEEGNVKTSMPNNIEPEVVYYSDTQCLAIQPHPEYMDKSSRFVVRLNELLEEKFGL